MAITINGSTGIGYADDIKHKLGTGNDLQIYHSDTGNKSYITHSGAGAFDIASTGDNLVLKSSEDVYLMVNDNETGVYCGKNGSVKLYHDNVVVSETTSTGQMIKMTSGEPTFRIHCDTDSSPLASIELMRGANDTFGADGYTDWKIADAAGGVFTISTGESGSTTSRITISTAGTLSGELTDTSDEKKKKNITSIPDGAIAKIKQLRPVTFNWKDPLNTDEKSGFIAQEVKTVIPNLVCGEEYDESKEGLGYSISTPGVVAHVTKALQEALVKIETLETKVAALEAA